MKIDYIKYLICPKSGSKLSLENKELDNNGDVISGYLINEINDRYPISSGIPNLLMNSSDSVKDNYALDLFKEKARQYDKYQRLSFETFYQNETDTRNSMIDKLHLKADSKILEINAGTGRDSLLIQERLSEEGILFVQDISPHMLEVLQEKTKEIKIPLSITQSNAVHLPYTDNTFDAIYSFGGVGMDIYADNKKVMAEIVRVAKLGARVVIGGLSLAPWLKDTEFGKILLNHNFHYGNEIKFSDFPIEARDFTLNWILSGAGFVIDFTIGEGEPEADFDYEIPGIRGGTHKTRYYGKLEGVTPETKELANMAREKLGISMHEWLDQLVKQEANKILNKDK